MSVKAIAACTIFCHSPSVASSANEEVPDQRSVVSSGALSNYAYGAGRVMLEVVPEATAPAWNAISHASSCDAIFPRGTIVKSLAFSREGRSRKSEGSGGNGGELHVDSRRSKDFVEYGSELLSRRKKEGSLSC